MTWIKNNIKKFWKWILGLLIGGTILAAGFGGTTTETKVINSIKTQQANYLSAGKYQHIPWTDIEINGILQKYKVDEYLKPDGKVGYQIFIQTTSQVQEFNATTSSMEMTNKTTLKTYEF